MKYLKIKTRSLVALAGRVNGDIDWNAMGTNDTIINMNKNTTAEQVDKEINYILPVLDEGKANMFIAECQEKNIDASLIDEVEAISEKAIIVSKRPKKQDIDNAILKCLQEILTVVTEINDKTGV
jgi:hypothetical protein